MFTNRPLAFQDFLTPASQRPQLWRLVVGIIVITVMFVGPTVALIFWAAMNFGFEFVQHLLTGATPMSMAVVLLTFLPLFVAAFLSQSIVHRLSPRSLIGPPGARLARNFFIASGVALAVSVLTVLSSGLEFVFFPRDTSSVITFRGFGGWAIWLVPGLVLIFIQTAAEELVFRGYLLQHLAARFRSPLVWAVLPSAVFGLAHFNPDYFGDNAWLYVINTTIAGTMLAFVTMRTGNIAAAVGLHFLNNVVAILIIGQSGYLDGLVLGVIDTDLTSRAVAFGILISTAVNVGAFAIWWSWMNRYR